jgi:hypothetical protein
LSGQQIGSVVGYAIGFYFGGPAGAQFGAAIGGMIGGWISPTQVNGPRIGDQADQSSQEGQPIPWVLGTCGWIQGNIVDKSKVREVKKTDDGKGSGTEVNTFEAHQDFCIMICESSEHRESLMIGVLIVKVDGKIVYDMRPESNFGADNAKFLKNHSFYDGNEAQLPDPTMEALPHNGVGNTPYYRGVFTMVARDINLTQYGERIPVYQFVMVGSGESTSVEIETLVAPFYAEFRDTAFPLASEPSRYEYSGTRVLEGVTETFSAATLEEVQEHFANDYGVYRIPNHYLGYSDSVSDSIGANSYSAIREQDSVVDNVSVVLVYSDMVPEHFEDIDGGFSNMCPVIGDPGCTSYSEKFADNKGRVQFIAGGSIDSSLPGYERYGYCSSFSPCSGELASVFGTQPLLITATRKKYAPDPVMGDPCLLGYPTLLPDTPNFVQDCEGNVFPTPTYSPASGPDVLVLQDEEITSGKFTNYILGPVMHPGDADDTEEYWTAAYDAAVAADLMPPGLVWDVDYPALIPADSVLVAISETTDLTTIPLGLDTAITRIVIRGGLTAEDIDVSEMDQDLLGYMVTQSYTGADSIRPLMTAFKSYGSEYDAKIHFHKHGEEIDLVVDPQDIIQGTEESDQTTRDQQVEFPRTYSITYIDATQDYTARPQVDRRISSDVRAIGEMQTQVAVVLPPDYARQLANVGMKVNWARAMGSREFSVPYAGYDVYLQAVAGKPFAMDAQRRIVSEMSLQDGEIQFKGVYDRQSAYTSDITATPALPPTPPPSNIGGVTLFAALNLPVLRDQDDVVGLYFAVAGLLNAWPGALLQVSADDQVSWETAIPSMTQSSVIGYLTAPLPLAPAAGDDVTNKLSVAVHGGQLNTITRLQYLNEGNPCAIVKPGDTGECEVLGFQYADEIQVDSYDLTTLVRGGLSTAPAAHAQGARLVGLDSVYFWQVPTAWIGRTLWFRPVTFGTAPENNVAYSIVFQPVLSQTEWQPVYLTGRYGSGSSFQLSVTPRHRLGNDALPIPSINFIGYRWTATDGTVTQTVDTVDPNATFDLSAFGTPITFTVSQLNRITGPGPSTSLVL